MRFHPSAFILFLAVTFTFSSCQLSRFVFYNFADITDHKIFPDRELKASATPFTFAQARNVRAPTSISGGAYINLPLDQILQKSKTVAFLVIQGDSIVYEKYLHGYEQSSVVASFSMAKSVTSMLIGCALEDGLISSVEEPITNYLRDLKDPRMQKVTIQHLLQMTSGIAFNESYVNPFGDAASFYYGRHLRNYILAMEVETAPGQQFKYISGNTQLLGAVLEKSLKGKTITAYLQEKIWGPLHMEYDGSWSLDKEKDGLEKTFCCLNARARDFAKLGRLYLKNGSWEGQQILPAPWVKESTKVDTAHGSSWNYQYQWWLPSKSGDFMAQGILGQFIYVNPDKDLIIVRLGEENGDLNWPQFFINLAKWY